MSVDVITYCPDVSYYQERLGLLYENDSPLKKYIRKDEGGYWIGEGGVYKGHVQKKDNKSYTVSRISNKAAFGLLDDEDDAYIDILNKHPKSKIYDPVMVQMSVGQMRDRFDDPCPFDKLDEDQIALIREIRPQFITVTIDDEDQIIEQGLIAVSL